MDDLEKLRIDRGPPSLRPRHAAPGPAWLLRGGALLALALAVWAFWRPARDRLDALRLPEVRVARAERGHPAAAGAVAGVAANGYLVAARRAALSADAPGRIVEMAVTEGSVVRQGDVVARLFADELAAALRRAEADHEAARAAVGRSEAAVLAARAERARLAQAHAAARAACEAERADLALARQQAARAERLAEEGVASPQALDEARAGLARGEARAAASAAQVEAAAAALEAGDTNVRVAEADRAVAAAQVTVAAAARELAAATLSKTEVRAPFDGVVVLKDAEVGEVVSPNVTGGSTARGSVVTLVDFASLEVQCDLPEASLAGVRVGGAARVFLDAAPGRAHPGRVDRIWPTANRQKATVEVRVRLDALDESMRPDMGVRVVFLPAEAGSGEAAAGAPPGEGAERPPPVLVPEAALVVEGGRTGVFVVERDVVRFREVAVDGRRAGQAAVGRGLEGGERVVLDPPARLESGDRVRVVEG